MLLQPFGIMAQIYADTVHANKNVLVEEFTAVHCFYCPAGHELLDSIADENPGRVFAVAMHAANTSYTAPYLGSPDFRRSYVDAFFSVPFATDSLRFFPGAFVNRRQWQPGRREQYTEKWRACADTILGEPSPVNIGMHTIYDLASDELLVDVEVYYTDSLITPHTLYIYITEDSLIAEQNNGGTNYVHDHIFRESLCAQWGDNIVSNGLPGTLFSANYAFGNSVSQYNMQKCHIIAFVRNAANDEVITVNAVPIEDFLTSDGNIFIEDIGICVFPNPFTDVLFVEIEGMIKGAVHYRLFDVTGKLLLSDADHDCSFDGQCIKIEIPAFVEGHFFILEISDGGAIIRKAVLRM